MKSIDILEIGDKILENGKIYAYVGYGENDEYEDHTFIAQDNEDDIFTCSEETFYHGHWEIIKP